MDDDWKATHRIKYGLELTPTCTSGMNAAYHRSGHACLTGTEPRRVFSLTLVSAGRGFQIERRPYFPPY